MNELSQFQKSDSDFAPVVSFRKNRSEPRYINPPQCREIPERLLKYEYAQDLAKAVNPEKGMRCFAILDGKFIAGDFIEAFVVEHNLHIKRMVISTLSMSENNVDSLANLLNGEYVDALDLIVSDYFFSHERRNLVPYLYQELDKDNRFQLAAASTHCKLCILETHDGMKIVMHGSANLRSSSNIEHICIEENPELYDFNLLVQSEILAKYQTIKKSVRRSDLWQAVQLNQKAAPKKPEKSKNQQPKNVRHVARLNSAVTGIKQA